MLNFQADEHYLKRKRLLALCLVAPLWCLQVTLFGLQPLFLSNSLDGIYCNI